ncbi:diuretic hormone receptor isoform X2 [Lepeophtheirus salmonis]|nr:diuretic hormone receptor-like isoform X2 [Lepeophtheirus salmonis]XP_040578061.1 diuretic hormone receptor-like isoform X2 [Lepeophtheirus salmonis]
MTKNEKFRIPIQSVEEEKCNKIKFDNSGCTPLFDKISCWPGGQPNTLIIIPCFDEFRGIKYDITKNATRFCYANKTWASKADYNECIPLNGSHKEYLDPEYSDYTHSIYFIGYSISLLTLLISFIVFISFKEMRCLRNKIHINLFFTYIMSNFFWILTSAFQTVMTSNNGSAYIWCISIVFLRYFHLSTFFWMFVEGLYLFVQVIATFSVENSTFKLRHYLIIGWGIPLMIIILWSTLTANSSSTIMSTWLNYDESNLTSQKYNYQEKNGSDLEHLFNDDTLTCPFIDKNSYEWIYTGPVIVVLMLNSFFLVWIMWVVITKLRSPNCSSEDNNHQHWKATKALLVIIPLLGITYMITIYAPSNGSVFANVLQHIRALLLSTQGFAVTLPYCFLNTEVRNITKNNWERWKMIRSLQNNSQNRNSITLATFYGCESRKNSLFRCV